MRKFSILNGMILLCLFFLWARPAEGVIFIEGDQDGQSGITVRMTDGDDPNDMDQSYPQAGNLIIRIDNGSRRYLGVYVDRIIIPQGLLFIDNGPNDELIGPASEIFTYETLAQFWTCAVYGDVECGPPPANRRYILPLPENLEPGTEVRFRVKSLGPAIGGTLPFPLIGTETPPEADVLINATALTTFEMLFLPLISTLTGGILPDEVEGKAILKDLGSFLSAEPGLISAYESGNYKNLARSFFNFLAGTETLKAFLENVLGIGPAEALAMIQNLILTPITVGELANVMIHLTTCQWLEEYDVWLIVPTVDDLVPDKGEVGETITVYGKGFDPVDRSNNTVYFTEINSDGWPETTLKAEALDVPNLETIYVRVPQGFHPGPVMVCVDDYCSNQDVQFGQASPSALAITSPNQGDEVSGVIDVEVVVTGPADPFPASQAILFVDDEPVSQQEVTSPVFSFSLDTANLSDGPHDLRVELDISGQELTASVEITIAAQTPDGPELFINSPAAGTHFKKNQVITLDAEVLNGPEVPTGSYGDIKYYLYIDGIREEYRSYSLTFADRYQFSFSFVNASLVPGPHNITLEAKIEQFVYPAWTTTDLIASVDFIIDDEFIGDADSVHVDGCIPYNSPVILYLNWETHIAPVSQAFTFGNCAVYDPHWGEVYRPYSVKIGLQEYAIGALGPYYSTGSYYGGVALTNTEARFFTTYDDEGCEGFPEGEGCWKIGWENYMFICPDPDNRQLQCCYGGDLALGPFCRIAKYSRTWCQGYDCASGSWSPQYCPYYDTSFRLFPTHRFRFEIVSGIANHQCPSYLEILE